MITALLALLGGLILPLAFLPFGIYTLGYISPAILCYTWLKASPKQAFGYGWLYGVGFFGVGLSWIYVSIHNFGNASVPIALLITLLFVVCMSLFFAIQGYVLKLIFKNKSNITQCLCAFPAMWVLFEWIRTHVFSGLPWLLLGFSQTNSLLSALSPLIGTFGISLCVAMIAGCLVIALKKELTRNKVISLLIIIAIALVSYFLTNLSWTHLGKKQQASLIQGNFSQSLKWDPNTLTTILDSYKTLSQNHLDSQLIVWPEAAIPYYPSQLPDYIESINALGKSSDTTFIIGAPTFDLPSKKYYNSLLMLGNNQGRYDKRHLVPFGEYTPFQWVFRNLMKTLSIPMSDFTAANNNQEPLHYDNSIIAPFICYEIIFPESVLATVKQSGVIVVINDDAWFGRSLALSQHLQMAQMAAQATQRYVLFCSNTGITAIIAPDGNINQTTPIDHQAVVTGSFALATGDTPIMQWGYYPIFILTILLLIIGLCLKKSDKKPHFKRYPGL